MKYLELLAFEPINQILSRIDSNDQIVIGRIEGYSCKSAGEDKKLYKKLQKDLLSSSPESVSIASIHSQVQAQGSPHQLGIQTHKLLYYLVATLNSAFPDYDFSDISIGHFKIFESISPVMNNINTALFNTGMNKMIGSYSDFTKKLWDAIDEAIQLQECEIFTYTPDMDSDPFGEEGCIWSFNYFFWNKKLKRIVFFYCRSLTLANASDEFTGSQSSRTMTPYKIDSSEEQGFSRSTSPMSY